MRDSRAFSLIELLIVIAIISILAAIAVPAYKQYKLRTTVASALPILIDFSDAMKSSYTKGTLGNTFTYGGITWQHGVGNEYKPFVNGNVALLEYEPPGSFPGVIGANQFSACVYLTNLDGIVDTSNTVPYIAPAGIDRGQRNRMCMLITEQNGVFTTRCGIYSSGGPGSFSPGYPYDVPAAYLPGGCNDIFLD